MIAHNAFLNTSGAPIQIGNSYGNLIANNIVEYSPGGSGDGFQERPAGYVVFSAGEEVAALTQLRNNLLLPRGDQGGEVPAGLQASKLATRDPFANRVQGDFRLKPDSDAIDLGLVLDQVAIDWAGAAPDAGPLEHGQPMDEKQGKFPVLPPWLNQPLP